MARTQPQRAVDGGDRVNGRVNDRARGRANDRADDRPNDRANGRANDRANDRANGRANDRPNDRWEEILEAALALFSARGYHATSMQDLADAVGLQKGSLYHYIRSKDELLYPLIDRALRGYLEDLEPVLQQGGTVRERLGRMIAAHVERVARYGDMMSVFISEARHLRDEEREQVRSLSARYRDTLVGLIEEGVATGEFAPCDARVVALALIGACNWLPQWYRPDGRLTPREIAEEFIRLFLDGLSARR